jgi:hypothetical protein
LPNKPLDDELLLPVDPVVDATVLGPVESSGGKRPGCNGGT